jgi:hypothetical protein
MMLVLVRLMTVLRLEKTNAPGKANAKQQGQSKPQAIVGVKRHLGKEIG